MVWFRKLGAEHYLVWTNKEEMDARKASLDLIINTGSGFTCVICNGPLYVASSGW
jgi:D-arabinose 1-dehydrogenase-like Zn-dependent alcohol dehydrogenase